MSFIHSEFEIINGQIAALNEEAAQASWAHWDSIAKPLRSLGKLEEYIVKIAALTGNPDVKLDKKLVLVLCADNGVVCEGVTQSDSSVTAAVAQSILRHGSSVCTMGATVGADVIPVDMGMNEAVEGTVDRHIRRGTGNIAVEPAMSLEEAKAAIMAGIDLVKTYKEQGYQIIATGEMGIGNTTTSAALMSVFLGLPIGEVTGRGAGLSDIGLHKKHNAIKRAIQVNHPDKHNPLEVLAKIGGLDIAGMVGLFIGGAIHRVPIVIDGLISSTAALVAAAICPACKCAMLASHCSAEPAAKAILDRLETDPIIMGELKLGEGTGAVCLFPLLDMALAVYNTSASFDDISVGQYVPQV
ncbi:MAG: nicotinate-nucleotide--dimethylbenzimidazole phosphoribosyltransferase [Parasporobacterium sp.]|nr:nicotinate-nucleotide--dimethylbenzimidazole phosphoribosyltransferase [Parasporobacterium sp.]